MDRSPRPFRPAARRILWLAVILGCAWPAHAETAGSPGSAAGSAVAESAAPRMPGTGAGPAGTTPPAFQASEAAGSGAGRVEPPGAGPAPVRPRQPMVSPEVELLTATVADLRGDVQRLQDEGAQLQTSNQRLIELNAQLRQEVESLALELQAARAGARQRWLLYGAGLLFLGVLTGVIVKARPRRSAWS